MATFVNIRGIPVSFPFVPYDIQTQYMAKVIECVQEEKNGILESPTGTGKTLSLLCSSLAWLQMQKQNAYTVSVMQNQDGLPPEDTKYNMWDRSTIIYSSRTHSQLTQAMKELKRTSYSNVRAAVLGSRDQLCIHPDVKNQASNSVKINMCKTMVKSRSCHYHSRVERMSMDKTVIEMNVADIEDLVTAGENLKFCPYFMTREFKNKADIIFLPYNYLLDPKARRAQQLDLKNAVIILDEAHNVEQICENSASFQIKTTDISLCIDELTQIMKHLEMVGDLDIPNKEQEFSAEDLMLLKTMFLKLEMVIDEIPLSVNAEEGMTYEGKYILEILSKAGIDNNSQPRVTALLESLIAFLQTAQVSAFQRSGIGLETIQDLLLLVFQKKTEEYVQRINECYKVHLAIEKPAYRQTQDTWLSKATSAKTNCRILSYWCFSPNFGMQMLMDQGVRCVILTSGTLSPMKPLILELGIDIPVTLENPHVITKQQICVKIITTGPDGVELNASYQNRSNEKYLNSMGMTITNICRQVPSGLLIFFPSYALLAKCQEHWQNTGAWSSLNSLKMIFVEPKTKDAFNSMMKDFYDRVKDPVYQGAIFMAVCRGKVSEGLDFADINGRAVIITGLPFPPYKEPRVVLKRKYLDVCKTKNKQYPSGQDWYGMEATRAVNQAIGRVIRHRHDYGAILLLDSRFNNNNIRNQLSLWVRQYITKANNFGELVRELRLFFKGAAELNQMQEKNNPTIRAKNTASGESTEVKIYNLTKPSSTGVDNVINIYNSSIPKNVPTSRIIDLTQDVVEPKRTAESLPHTSKRFKVVAITGSKPKPDSIYSSSTLEFKTMMKSILEKNSYITFIHSLKEYKETKCVEQFIRNIDVIFGPNRQYRFLIQGILPFVDEPHKEQFNQYWEAMR